jgi:hypothetical protein
LAGKKTLITICGCKFIAVATVLGDWKTLIIISGCKFIVVATILGW